jgi:hypothetical protein
MLGTIILSSVGVVVIATVFVALLWAAVLDGREQARVDALAGVRTTTPVPADAVPRRALDRRARMFRPGFGGGSVVLTGPAS